MTGRLVFISCGCVLWCCLHSLLISRPVASWVKERLGRFRVYYRLLYNVVSFVSLLPLILVVHSRPGSVMFSWTGNLILLRFFFLFTALACFYSGSRHYDLGNFLGLQQIRSGREQRLLSGEQVFSRQGILGIIRHPWYAGGLLFLWSIFPQYSKSVCAAGSVFSLYLVVGACLEERRIHAEFGDIYRQYQQDVSMFFPWKWLKKKFSGGTNGPR